jgi:hypothetical protein
VRDGFYEVFVVFVLVRFRLKGDQIWFTKNCCTSCRCVFMETPKTKEKLHAHIFIITAKLAIFKTKFTLVVYLDTILNEPCIRHFNSI